MIQKSARNICLNSPNWKLRDFKQIFFADFSQLCILFQQKFAKCPEILKNSGILCNSWAFCEFPWKFRENCAEKLLNWAEIRKIRRKSIETQWGISRTCVDIPSADYLSNIYRTSIEHLSNIYRKSIRRKSINNRLNIYWKSIGNLSKAHSAKTDWNSMGNP